MFSSHGFNNLLKGFSTSQIFKGKGGKHDKIHRDVCIYSMGIFYSGVADELKPTDYSIAHPVSSTQDGCGFFWKTVHRIHA